MYLAFSVLHLTISFTNYPHTSFILHFFQSYEENQTDLTGYFVNGARSIKVGESAGTWRVFPDVGFNGDAHADLKQGGYYPNPRSMGLSSPVKSMKKAE